MDPSAHDEESRMFATDDELDRRLAQVENMLSHLEAGIPAMRREVAQVRRLAFPSLHREQPEPEAA